MSDLIKRSDVISAFAYSAPELFADAEWFRIKVEKIPSASKTGEWNCDENAIYHCSECGCVTTWDYNYCPDCGAMMNGGEEE